VTKRCDKTEEIEVLPTYYERRKDKGRSIYLRMVAPKDVAPLLPPESRTFRKSLLTSNVKEATLRGAPLIHSKLAEWDKVRQQLRQPVGPTVIPSYLTGGAPSAPGEIITEKTQLTPQLISNLVAARMNAWVRMDDRERRILDDEGFDEAEEFSRMSLPQLRKFIARGAQEDKNPDLVEQILDTGEMLGVQVDVTDLLFPQLVREFALGEVKIHELLNQRNNGEWPDVARILPKVGAQLSTMAEPYRNHKLKTASTHYVGTGVSVWKDLIEFKGDVFLAEVSSRDIYELMEYHLNTTKKWGASYLSKVKTYIGEIFSLAITLSYFDGPNPVERIRQVPQLAKAERAARDKPRYPLSSQQINAIFASEWYNPRATRWRGQIGSDLGVRYFMPLISVLHGPRVREPLQLMTDEIIERDGIVCFNFKIEFDEDGEKESQEKSLAKSTDEAHSAWPSRSLKNNAVSRVIPVHPKLLELGFMDYVQARRKELGRPGPLFQSALPEPGGKSPKYGRAYEQAMLRFMKDKLGFPSGYGNHSHRHQFEDRIREANSHKTWPAGMWQFLSGRQMVRAEDRAHAAKVGSEKDYGNGYSPAAVLRWQATLDFSDLQFPLPYNAWKISRS